MSDVMTSPTSDGYVRQNSVESGVDNPFRPGGELDREAETVVTMIKEGKPIVTIKRDDNMVDGGLLANGLASDAADNSVKENVCTAVDANGAKMESKSGANGSAPPKPGVIEVRHGVIAPTSVESQQVEQVNLKKKSKAGCCVIQ